MEKEPSDPAQGRAVDRGRCTTQERPFLLAEVRNGGIRVVEEGDHHWDESGVSQTSHTGQCDVA